MKKTIATALIILASLALQAQDCPPPKQCILICNELQITKKYWEFLTPKDKVLVKEITLNKYGKIDPICLRNREAREFLEYLKTI